MRLPPTPTPDASVQGIFSYTPAVNTVLSAGSHQTLQVTFTPADATNYVVVFAATSINVTQHSTSITLTASAPSGAPGQSIVFTAIVAGGLPAPYLPTGSVQFQINGVNTGSPVPLGANDTATFSTTEPASGSFTVTAVYAGDTNFQSRSSSASTETVLSPGAYAVGSTLYVVGANTADAAAILPWGSKTDGSTGLSIVASLNRNLIVKAFTQTFTAIDVFGYNGNDSFGLWPTLSLPTSVVEGNGNNLIVLANGADTVTMGTGNNSVIGGDGNKTITGNEPKGSSTSVLLGNGNNVITLGPGNDAITVGKGNNAITAGNGNNKVLAVGNGNNIVTLGNGNDSVTLGDGANTVTLGNGNDQVSAGKGNNNVTVGNGNDTIKLGNGSNVVVAGNGNNTITAGNGANLVIGGLGQNTIQLGDGNNILIDGSATVVDSNDSFRQILTDWNASSSTTVSKRLKVVYNTSHPNVLKAGGGRDWWFYTYKKDVTNIKKTDFLN